MINLQMIEWVAYFFKKIILYISPRFCSTKCSAIVRVWWPLITFCWAYYFITFVMNSCCHLFIYFIWNWNNVQHVDFATSILIKHQQSNYSNLLNYCFPRTLVFWKNKLQTTSVKIKNSVLTYWTQKRLFSVALFSEDLKKIFFFKFFFEDFTFRRVF